MEGGVERGEGSVWGRGDGDVGHWRGGVVHVGGGVEGQKGLHVAARTSQLWVERRVEW